MMEENTYHWTSMRIRSRGSQSRNVAVVLSDMSLLVPTNGISVGLCTFIIVMMTATIAFCSSIYASAIQAIADDFHCSRLVSTLGITTFLLGFASGPLVFAPLSEVW